MTIPLILGDVRRGRRVADTVWEGWDTRRGHRLLLREGGSPPPGMLPMEPIDAHVRGGSIDATLADFLPLDDAPDVAWLGAILAGVLRSLQALHETRGVYGKLDPELIVSVGGRWTLAWSGPCTGDAADDLRALGGLLGELDPTGVLAGALDDDPPPSAADARRLVQRALASHLAHLHNDVVGRGRQMSRARRLSRLRGAMRALVTASPPPVATGCLRAGLDGVVHLVQSDGISVRGGATVGTGMDRLPLVWQEGRLEVQQARVLLRAWAGRARGDEDARARTQRDVGGDDGSVAALTRWLAAAARLRTDAMLLDGSEARKAR